MVDVRGERHSNEQSQILDQPPRSRIIGTAPPARTRGRLFLLFIQLLEWLVFPQLVFQQLAPQLPLLEQVLLLF